MNKSLKKLNPVIKFKATSLENMQLPKDTDSFLRSIQNDYLRKLKNDFFDELKKTITERLLKLGFKFKNDVEFNEFCQDRITKVSFEDKPFENCIYLDFVSNEQRGVLLTYYSTEVKFDFSNPLKITATIG